LACPSSSEPFDPSALHATAKPYEAREGVSASADHISPSRPFGTKRQALFRHASLDIFKAKH